MWESGQGFVKLGETIAYLNAGKNDPGETENFMTQEQDSP